MISLLEGPRGLNCRKPLFRITDSYICTDLQHTDVSSGAAVLGMKFALTTLVSTFYYPIILGILENVPVLQNVTDDKMLSTICGGLMIGLGIRLL